MLKFNRASPQELTVTKQRKPKIKDGELEPPKNISLESLQALVEEHVVAEPGPPPRISLESLRKLLPRQKTQSIESANSIFHVSTSELESPEAISLENLQLLVQTSTQLISPQASITVTTRNLLISTNTKIADSGKLRVWKIEDEAEVSAPIEKVVEVIPAQIEPMTPQAMIERLRELSENPDSLEAWIQSVNLPKEINVPEIRERIKEFLKNKSWEQHKAGKIRNVTDGSLALKLWNAFKDLSTVKQILVIIGLSLLIAALTFLTVQLLSLLWPSLLGLGTSGDALLREIGVEAFKQRQEPAFHLLLSHAEQAKPMSYAWANQYVLYKYLR